jgi:chorismate mutase-like protein
MISSEAALEDLRREIDRVDDSIHDLLMHRASIVQRVAEVKREGGPRFRPAREARMLRRLIGRHQGPFPKMVLARIWREMLGATVRLQGTFSLGVHAPDGEPGCWDLAREHFGAYAPIALHGSTGQIVSEVVGGKLTLGILPRPREDEPAPWWPLLFSDDAATPRVVARLPFAGRMRARAEEFDAVAIARQAPEESGDDIALIAIETDGTLSRATLKAALTKAGFAPQFFASWHDPTKAGTELTLAEVAGHVAAGDRRLAKLVRPSIRRAVVIGGYAVPLSDQALADR